MDFVAQLPMYIRSPGGESGIPSFWFRPVLSFFAPESYRGFLLFCQEAYSAFSGRGSGNLLPTVLPFFGIKSHQSDLRLYWKSVYSQDHVLLQVHTAHLWLLLPLHLQFWLRLPLL